MVTPGSWTGDTLHQHKVSQTTANAITLHANKCNDLINTLATTNGHTYIPTIQAENNY